MADIKYSLVIHGGAGTITRASMSAEKEKIYRAGLDDALNAGKLVLEKGGDAVSAVLAACTSLEDNELFNAGKGSVFAHDGSQEMDASVMDGKNLMAGAVLAVKNVRNPVLLAYKIMMESEHVMLVGQGALEFAQLHGLKIEPDEYFYAQHRFDQLQRVLASGETILDHTITEHNEKHGLRDDRKFGTIGACARDINGNIAAATSTGGMTNKKFGRVGDSPVIGAGTYANNNTCAISCTGHGEPFIRAVTAYDVSCLMEYKGLSLQEAMDVVVHEKLIKINGEGGMIGVDGKGNTAMSFNSEGMYRGMVNSMGERVVKIYKD